MRSYYSQTCARRPPKGLAESGRLLQVVASCRMESIKSAMFSTYLPTYHIVRFEQTTPWDDATPFTTEKENTTEAAIIGGPEDPRSMPSSKGLVSGEAAETVQAVLNGVLLPILLLCGVTGNVINMAVFSRQGLRDRVNVCLFSLAISDSGFNIFHFASRVDSLLNFFSPSLAEYWHSRGLMFIGVYMGFLNTSNILILVISIERCICVINPLRAKRLLSARKMVIVVVSIFTVCLVGTGIGSFKFIPVPYTDPATNATRYRTGLTEFYQQNHHMFDAIFEITFNAVVPTVTLMVVIAATVAIAVRMRSVVAWRKETAHVGASQTQSAASLREASVTRMLLVVATVYTLCTIPSVTQALVRSFIPQFVAGGPYNNIFFVTITITHLLEVINCSANFWIYYAMSTRYRETLRDMVGNGCMKKKKKKKYEEKGTVVSTLSSSSVGDNKSVTTE